MKIAIASDHAGFDLKISILAFLQESGHTVKDFGAYSAERANYPELAKIACQAVVAGDFERAILICGTGVGMSVTANKIRGIRAVVCSEPYSAVLSREHNDSNVLAMGGRVVGPGLANYIVEEWLAASFEGGRHAERLALIEAIEKENERD
ncbi:MAG: ribose 5-phosphate isomerase B [Anaerolineaceae bacterium]